MGIFILLERVRVLSIKFIRITTLLFHKASGNGRTFSVATKLARFLTVHGTTELFHGPHKPTS
jgi:hypothetical protein